MKFCKDCKHFIDNTPPSHWNWFFWLKISTNSGEQFCNLESGRNLVTGEYKYAFLERRTGQCGEEGIFWEQR
jgi:hypothetical protein